jgi:hypothetical protein
MNKMTIIVDSSELSGLYDIFSATRHLLYMRDIIFDEYSSSVRQYVLVFNKDDIELMRDMLPRIRQDWSGRGSRYLKQMSLLNKILHTIDIPR